MLTVIRSYILILIPVDLPYGINLPPMQRHFIFYSLFLGLLALVACADPVTPKYQFETGLLLVDGRIADVPGYSEVRVSRNELVFGTYQLLPLEEAVVSSVAGDGMEVVWEKVLGTSSFRAPAGWAGRTGETYFLRVVTAEGEVVETEPEAMPVAVPINNLRVQFEQEAYFSVGRNRFIPAFKVLVDLQDPGETTDFYQFGVTTYEAIDVCKSCFRSVFRNGECISGPGTRFVERYDYLCDAPCWAFTKGQNTNILSDAFSQGQLITNVEAGRDDYDRSGGLLFDVQQYVISRAAFDYLSVVRDVSEGSGGLNAPPPAALIGNARDVSERKTDVLGFVGVAAIDTLRIFIQRDTFGGTPLPFNANIRLEPLLPNPPAAPCEGGNFTRQRPDGWQG